MLRKSKVDAAYEEIVPTRRICSCAPCRSAAVAGGYRLRPTAMRRHYGLLHAHRLHGDSRLRDAVPPCKLSDDSTSCIRGSRLQQWILLASIGQRHFADGNTSNLQACQQHNAHAGGPVLREGCCHSGDKIIRRRGCRGSPQAHPLPGLQNLNLSLQFQRM